MITMNCFYGVVDQWKALNVIPTGVIVRNSHNRKLPTRAAFVTAENSSPGLVEKSCAIVIITTQARLVNKEKLKNVNYI